MFVLSDLKILKMRNLQIYKILDQILMFRKSFKYVQWKDPESTKQIDVFQWN